MKILITGAGGFVGKRLTQMLAASGHDVLAMVHRPVASDDRSYYSSERVTTFEADIATFNPAELPTDVDAIMTLAQSNHFREFPDRATEIFSVNVSANLALLQWAAATGVTRVVHASSGGIYGGRKGALLSETDQLAVDSPLGFYLGTKLCSEILVQNYRHLFKTAVILRPFFIYGPGQRSDMLIPRLVGNIRAGRPVVLSGESGIRINPVYIDDAVNAFARALDLEGAHVINLGGPDVRTLREIAETIGRAVGRAPVLEQNEGEPADYVGDVSKAAEQLGPSTIGFEEGIARMVADD